MMTRTVFLLLVCATFAVANDPDSSLPASSSEETKQAVIALLRENRQKYGDDAAILQGLLLVHANQSGAMLATEAAIVGFEDLDRRRYVAFRLDSGTIFDDSTTNREERLERIWQTILERTLRRYPTFSVPGDGIAVEIQYSHRRFESPEEIYRTPDEIGTVERAKFYILTGDLTAFLENRLDASGLLERSRILLDEKFVPLAPHDLFGPPRPGTDPQSGPLY